MRQKALLVAAVVLAAFLVSVAVSWTVTMSRPSSQPLSIRTVEWVRDNHGAWLVNLAERVYYSFRAPEKGGPALTALPAVAAGAVPAEKPSHQQVPAYRPPAIPTLLEPALRHEGQWRQVVPPVGERPPILVTVFRPDRAYPRMVAYVAWIDQTITQTALYPGRYQPPNAPRRGAMEVPPRQRFRILAVFNSGFKYQDGQGGFAVNGRTYEPLRKGQGTVVGYTDGRVDVIAWHGGRSLPRTMVFARQNLPLIVRGGRLNPALNDQWKWGSTLGNAVRVWRTALGVDARGNLVYLAAPDQTAASLARAIRHAGAVRAIEMDINPYWPTFNVFHRPGGNRPAQVVPNASQPVNRFLVPDDRDFFAVYRLPANRDYTVPLQ